MSLTVKSLQGGHLADVMSARMFDGEDMRKAFARKCKKPDKSTLDAYAKLYGWRPPAELAEWQGVAPGHRAFYEAISDVWMIGGSLDYVTKKKPTLERLINHHDGLITLLTGLEHFGDDPSGDRSFVSTLPHPHDLAEVHVYNHENGELDGSLYYSIADFVFSCWGDEDDGKKIMAAFNGEMKAAKKKQSKLEDPRALFNRMKWMWGLPAGEPGYHFAEDMGRAPTYADWEAEKKLIAKSPVLANYWLLAHYFLGNTAACAEAVKLAKKAPGTLTPALAKMIETGKIGKLKAGTLAELREAVHKNAESNLLEPGARDAVERERSAGVKKADTKKLAARMADGEDGWALIAEFPDDVAAHDFILAKLAKKDKALADRVEAYESARAEDSVWRAWPSEWELKKKPFDRRLSPVVGAAFRSGLKYDADNKRAYASLVNTLVFLDDDAAMDGFAAAVEALKMDDARLEYVVKGLRQSKHARAKSILNRAAWRFFELFDATVKSKKKTDKEGPTLNNMFRVHSHLLIALIASIRIGDDESEKLTDKVCSITDNMTVLGVAYASAFIQVGKKKLERHQPLALGYCKLVDGLDGEGLPSYAHYNFAEAGLAVARLAPEKKAEPFLRGVLAKKRSHPQMHLDVVGGALAGLLYLAPHDPELIGWAERILGNRTRAERVYGALRGVAEGKVGEAKEWVRWHLYAGSSSNHIGENLLVQGAARSALVALGEPEAPPFDESDEFGSKVPLADLPKALLVPQRHQTDWVFKRIVEKEVRSLDVVEIGGQVLADVFRFSADDGERSSCDERKEGLKAMIFQGAPALPMLASLLALPHMAPNDKTVVLYTMSIITDAPTLFARLATSSKDEVLALLEHPTPETMGAIDLVAGWAFATLGESSRAAVEAALRWRFSLLGPGYDHWVGDEPTAARLALLMPRFSGGKRMLDAQKKALDNDHVKEVIEHATTATLAPLEGMGGASERAMLQHLRGEQRGPRYTCTVGALGKRVKIRWKGEDIHFEGILDGNHYEQSGAIDAASPDDARAIADRVCQAAGAVGLQASKPPEPKAKGKKKKR